jgi:hypothetical protein
MDTDCSWATKLHREMVSDIQESEEKLLQQFPDQRSKQSFRENIQIHPSLCLLV